MIEFILNDVVTTTEKSAGYRLLDFIRLDKGLTGTKEGCREGDCGACLVLLGELKNNRIQYRSVTSCLTLLGEIDGCHILTIEGVSGNKLNPIQQSTIDENASQCGYCTPGFLLSMTGYLLTCKDFNYEGIIKALDGNICRCTGYASIKRVAQNIIDYVGERKEELLNSPDRIDKLIEWNLLPEYVKGIEDKLRAFHNDSAPKPYTDQKVVAGGTDLVVQNDEEVENYDLYFINKHSPKNEIKEESDFIYIGASTTVTDIYESDLLKEHVPEIGKKFHLISSTPIRNMATLAGNFVNASPIGDLSVFFLTLNAELILCRDGNERIAPLKDFFLDYKKLDLQDGEVIEWTRFPIPDKNMKMNFEKISKRERLDIASVNSALSIIEENNIIKKIEISAGGVAPVPKYLSASGESILGKEITSETVKELADRCAEEVSPISDMRGTAEYKRMLLRNLIYAHFIELYPEQISSEVLV